MIEFSPYEFAQFVIELMDKKIDDMLETKLQIIMNKSVSEIERSTAALNVKQEEKREGKEIKITRDY